MKNPNAIVSSDYGPLIVSLNDKVISRTIINSGYWAVADIELILKILEHLLEIKKKIVIFDVGANIGTHSLAFAKKLGDRVFVRAFEAQRIVYNMLCGNMAINGISNVVCHNLVVGERAGGFMEFAIPDYNADNNFGALELIPPKNSDMHDMKLSGKDLVETVTLSSFEDIVDFIKMDIEGMEDKAMAGAQELFERSRPICFIEIHKTDSNYIIEFLRARNYRIYILSMDLIAIPSEMTLHVNGANMLS